MSTSVSDVVDANKGLYKKAFDKLYFNKENLYKQQDLAQWGLSKQDLENIDNKIIENENNDEKEGK